MNLHQPICHGCNDLLDHQDPEYCLSCFAVYQDATAELQAEVARLRGALAVADDALATIHDTVAWVNENEPDEWTQREEELTNHALDVVRKALGGGEETP